MVELLSQEADKHGTALNDLEKKMLGGELGGGVPEDLRIRSHKLKEEILEREVLIDQCV